MNYPNKVKESPRKGGSSGKKRSRKKKDIGESTRQFIVERDESSAAVTKEIVVEDQAVVDVSDYNAVEYKHD